MAAGIENTPVLFKTSYQVEPKKTIPGFSLRTLQIIIAKQQYDRRLGILDEARTPRPYNIILATKFIPYFPHIQR